MHYHSWNGKNWLISNGLNPNKAGSVEINQVKDYIETRNLWGVGGVLLHELCHAFHDKHTNLGYGCHLISNAYETAMNSKLYLSVAVHGSQGRNGPIKAYACTNCMEFWAELSVAYHCKNIDEEYNKWYPHNYHQLQEYDPNTFDVINKLWNLDDLPINSPILAVDHI